MDEVTQTVTLPANDWKIILAALYELPAKHSVPVIGRLQEALAPQPAEITRLRNVDHD